MLFILPTKNSRSQTADELRAKIEALEMQVSTKDIELSYLLSRVQTLEAHCYRLQNELDSTKTQSTMYKWERDDYASLYEVDHARLCTNLQNKSYARLVAWLEKQGHGKLLEKFHGCEEIRPVVTQEQTPKKEVHFVVKQSPVHHESTGVGGMKRCDTISRKKKKVCSDTSLDEEIRKLLLM